MAFAIRLALFLAFHRSQLFILLPPHSKSSSVRCVPPATHQYDRAFTAQHIGIPTPSHPKHSVQHYSSHNISPVICIESNGRHSALLVPSISQSQPLYSSITDDVWPFQWIATHRLLQYIFEHEGHRCCSKQRNISWQLAIFREKLKTSNDVTAFIEVHH